MSGEPSRPTLSGEGGEFGHLLGIRLGPYRSFNPVSRTQIWQWCSAMGEGSPLYLDDDYRAGTEFAGRGAVAPPAMMQMWTMRDINDAWAPGSATDHPYPVMDELERRGFPENVAVSYDLRFHRYLVEGDRVHHYKSVVDISELKKTALGEGHFFTDRMEYLDQHGELFAEALITYLQYRPVEHAGGAAAPAPVTPAASDWRSDYRDLDPAALEVGQPLPALSIPITHRLIIGGAIATQDFIPVHHSLPAARAAGMDDIFMNILTSCGLCGRYLGDWAGPRSRLRRLKLRLQTPNMPGDTMTFQGKVAALCSTGAGAEVDVEFAGLNSLGPHVLGSATLGFAATGQPQSRNSP
jgi:acyl dehydratase